MKQGAGRQRGACGARVKIGNQLLFACAFAFIMSPSELLASADTPLPAKTAFAYSVSHTVKPLPDSVIERVATPEVDSIDDVDNTAVETHEPPVDVRIGAPRPMSRNGLCSAMASVAKANNLPIPFFANLIWSESSFDTKTISRAGALGIAQFMPKTANEFGLINPFEPIHALNVAGKFVRELYQQFGNIGLAAAAYNAGPRRVIAWMAKRGELPAETRAYVIKITGRPAEDWTAPDVKKDPEMTLLPAKAPCVEVAEAVKAQSKTVHTAKLMMDIASAARETRDKQEEAAPDVIGPIAEAGWRTRALRMVRTMLQRLEEKEAATKVAVRKAIRLAAKDLSHDEDKAPSRNARRSAVQIVDGRSSTKTPDKTPEKAVVALAAAKPELTKPEPTKPAELIEAKFEPNAAPKTDGKGEAAEQAKPVTAKSQHRRRSYSTNRFAYSNSLNRPF
jgi:hypothetical protein